MKKYILFIFAAVTFLSVSCVKEIENSDGIVPTNSHVVFKTKVDSYSKATITPNGGDTSFESAWEGTDQVTLYAKSDTFDEEAQATWNTSTEAFEGDFIAAAPVVKESWEYEAKYPYDDDGYIPFGSDRTQNGNSYNSAYDIMYGTVSYSSAYLGQDNSGNVFVIPMHRLTGIAYFHITGGSSSDDVLSATLSVNSGSIAAETVAINGTGTAVVPTNGVNTITITFPAGHRPKANDIKLWFNVLPGTYTGMNLVIKTENKTASIASNTTITYNTGELNKVSLSDLNWIDYDSNSITWSHNSSWDSEWSPITDGYELVDGHYTLQILTAEAGTAATINGTVFDARVYAGGKVKVSFDGYAMNRIVFNISTQGKKRLAAISASSGTIATQALGDDTVVWTGKSQEVTFTVGAKSLYGSDGVDKAGQLDFDSIDVDIVEDGLTNPGLSFGETSCNALTNVSFVAPTLTNPHSLTVSYSSTNTGVATVNASTGAISIVSAGSTTIKAAFAGDATYRAATPSYELVVAAPSIAASAPANGSYKNGSTSFTVTANCTWEAVKGNDDDDIIESISTSGDVVTVTFNDNSDEVEKSASVFVNQTGASSSPASLEVVIAQNAKPGVPSLGTMVWSEDFTGWSSWTASASGAGHVYGGGSVSYSKDANTSYKNESAAGAVAPEVMVSKNSGYFTVSDVPISFATSATLFYTTNNEYLTLSTSPSSTITVKNYGVVGPRVRVIEITGIPADTDAMSLTLTDSDASNNSRIDNLELKAGTKSFQTLSYASPSVTWTIGTDCTIDVEESSPQNVTGASTTVSYSSSDETVAVVNASTGDITVKKKGVVVITATAAEDGSYWKGYASYTLNITEGGVVLEWSRPASTDNITTGFTALMSTETKSGYRQDGSGTLRYVGAYHKTNKLFTSTPSSVTVTAKIGGGTVKDPLDNSVYVCFVDDKGSDIAGSEVTLTTKVEVTTGKDYSVSMSTEKAVDAYGIKIYHTKETGYNVRYYSFSIEYE